MFQYVPMMSQDFHIAEHTSSSHNLFTGYSKLYSSSSMRLTASVNSKGVNPMVAAI